MKTISGPFAAPAHSAAAFDAMLPLNSGGALVGHPAVMRLLDAAQGVPLHPAHRLQLMRFGATPRSLDYLDHLIVNSRSTP
jgi:hypothetical protein